MNFWSPPQLQPLGQLVANVADGRKKSEKGAFLLGFAAHDADEYARVFHVRRHATLGNGDQAFDARVFQFARHHDAQFVSDLLGDPLMPMPCNRHCLLTEYSRYRNLNVFPSEIPYKTSSSWPIKSRPKCRSESSSTVRKDCSRNPALLARL